MTKKIIVFNGPPGSGKDTATHIAGARLYAMGAPAIKMKMSDPIKQAVHKLYGLFYEPGYYDSDKTGLKDQPHPLLFGMSPRQAYIDLSAAMIERHGDNYFGRIAANRMHNMKGDIFVFSDSGIFEEWPPIIEYVKPENVLWIEIVAYKDDQQLSFEGDSRAYIGEELKVIYPKLTLKLLPNHITNDPLDKELFGEMVKGTVDNFFKDVYRHDAG